MTIICAECGKEITEGRCFVTYTDPDDPDKSVYACDACNRKAYSAS